VKRPKRSQQKIITIKSRAIRYMRISKGITQSAAAKAAGCSKQAIGHYETGRMDIPRARLSRLIEAYGYTEAEFDQYLQGKAIPILKVKDECIVLLDRIATEEKLLAVLTILKSFAS
jgi:transcriptional regulator with XRE-family HTH domain